MTNYKNINNMLIIYNKNKSQNKFIIDWSAKSGCTTILKIFLDYMDLLDKFKNYHWIHNCRPIYYNEYGRVDEQLLFSNEYLKIKFVRNPYSRAVSSYLHVMNTKLKNKFRHKNMSFHTFLLSLKSRELNDIHYNLQMTKEEKNNKIFDKVIKIENLSKEILEINSLYNINLNCNFSSFHHKKIDTKVSKNISYKKYSQIKNIPSYNFFYDQKIKNLVYKIYKEDIEKYDYTFDEFLKSCE